MLRCPEFGAAGFAAAARGNTYGVVSIAAANARAQADVDVLFLCKSQ